MKTFFKSVIAFKLAILARLVVRRYRPHVVMVTGSVGKTSTKDAVAAVLAARFYVRKSQKSFNSEFGVPFTILDVDNPWDNPLAWFSLVKKALALLILPNHYPNMLVLEVGADQPGDLARILRIVTPDAVVVTRLPDVPVHVEAYASPEAVREEEFSPAYALAAGAPLIVSADDPHALESARRVSARLISYGAIDGAQVHIGPVSFYKENDVVVGMHTSVTVDGESGDLIVKGSVGATQVFPPAAALGVAQAFSIPFAEALVALEAYEPPAGRGRLFAGKGGSIVIDDSYNSSPVAAERALETLRLFPGAVRRIAVLGDMLELGRYSVEEHARIGALARHSADIVAAVGIRARAFASAEGEAEVLTFDNSYEAATALAGSVGEGDVILIKGSQSIRTERIVKALLANPSDTARLVRQERKWQERI